MRSRTLRGCGVAAQAILLILLASCTRRTVSIHDPVPVQPSAIRATMQHQVLNAVDAGTGDVELQHLRELAAAEPENVDVRLALAAHYNARGFPDLALEHYRLAAERFPDSKAAVVALARALQAADQNLAARDAVVSFCKQHPQEGAELFSRVGIIEDGLGNFASAEPWHRAAMQREPDSDVLHNNLGYNLLLQQLPAAAATEFQRALELNPRSEIARNNLGIALAENPKEAVLEWQSISDPATAHSNMAAVFIEQKRYPEARQEIQRALEYSPNHTAALENLRLLAELDGNSAEPSKPRKRQRVALALRRALGAGPASN